MPAAHPLWAIKYQTRKALHEAFPKLSRSLTKLREGLGRPNIPPEPRHKDRIVTPLLTVRRETLFCVQRGLRSALPSIPNGALGVGSFSHGVFAGNYDRAVSADAAELSLARVYDLPAQEASTPGYRSTATVTRIESLVRLKSSVPKDRAEVA